MLTLPCFRFGLTLSVGTTLVGVASHVGTGSSGGSYSSVDQLYVSTCTAIVADVCVSTGDVSSELVVVAAEAVPLESGYFLVTGLVVNCLAFSISLFARIRAEDGPLSFGLLQCLLASFLDTMSMDL